MTVRSAGLETTPGKPADDRAKAVALEHQLSLDAHATTQVHRELLDQSDLIIVMEIVQKDRVQRLCPRSKGKVMLLGRFDSGGSLEVADPYSGDSEDFLSCFHHVSRCCDNLAGGQVQNCRFLLLGSHGFFGSAGKTRLRAGLLFFTPNLAARLSQHRLT